MKTKAVHHIWLGFFIFIAILVFGTVGYIVIEDWNFYDSFYMTILSISTTGFEEVHPLSNSGKILTIIVIITGLTAIAYLGGRVAQALIETYIFRRRESCKMLQLYTGPTSLLWYLLLSKRGTLFETFHRKTT